MLKNKQILQKYDLNIVQNKVLSNALIFSLHLFFLLVYTSLIIRFENVIKLYFQVCIRNFHVNCKLIILTGSGNRYFVTATA